MKFIYNGNVGLTYEAEHDEVVTVEQARVMAELEKVAAHSNIATALNDFSLSFSAKDFYDEMVGTRGKIVPKPKTSKPPRKTKRR